MGMVRNGWQWLRSLGRQRDLERGLDDEIRFHVDQQVDKHIAAGMPPGEARRQALIRLGSVQRTKDAARDEFRPAHLENLLRDLRYGHRALMRAPGFTAVAVLTLGLGIGATTAMFSIVNGVLLRPLPYPDQDRLIDLVHEAPGMGIDTMTASPAIYFGYRDHGRVFDAVGMWDWDSSPVTVTGAGEPESVPSIEVTHEILPMLGAQPIAGRGFRPSDDAPGAAPTAMISYGYWQRHFAGANPVGRVLVVEGVPRQIIGVLPQSFRFFDYAADIYYPLQFVRADARFPSSDGRGIARLKPGVTLAQASTDGARIIPLIAEEFGRDRLAAERTKFGPRLRLLKDSVVGDLGNTLWILLGTIALLMLIACANVANLMLVRAQARQPELVLRAALGAGKAAVARVVFTESALLGLAGGVLGLVVAYASLPVLVSLGEDELPGVMAIGIDPTVMLVALGSALLATVLFAFVPVVQMALPRLALATTLQAGGRSMAGTRGGNRVRHMLVVAQVALALVLLVGSGLMIRTFDRLRNVDPGFSEPDTVLTFQLTLPSDASQPTEPAAIIAARTRILRAHQAIHARLSEVPGVQSVGFASGNDPLPLDGDGRQFSLVPFIDGRQAADGAVRVWEQQRVSPGFYETMGTPILAGRALDWNDIYERRPVMMASESVARKEWGSAAAAVGHRAGPAPEAGVEVVGVMKDVRHGGMNQPVTDTVAAPAVGIGNATYVVRSPRVGTAAFLRQVREAIWEVNPNLSPARVQTLGDLYDRSMARTSMTLLLLAITGSMALVLGLIGIYGVVSYAVSQRRREIGVRLALGAGRSDVRRMFVWHALGLVTIGVAIGLGAAAALTRLMASQLFGVTPLDPATHASVALGMAAAAGIASYVSATRGTAIDPITVLRGD
jgi:putative ABC transport system permease protein